MTQTASAYEHLRTVERGSARIPDFLLGLVMPLPLTVPGTGTNASMIALGVASILAFIRTPPPNSKLPPWAFLITGAMIGWVGLSVLYNGQSVYQQYGYFVMFTVSILAFASGRIDRVSICRGVGVGLAIGALAGLLSRFAGIGGNPYPGRLTGYVWGDPNQAGYFLTVLTAVALVGIRPGWRRWGALALFIGCIGLTLSRTSLVAMLVAGTWFLVRRRVSPTIGVGITGVVAYVLSVYSEPLRNWGPFAERSGSDSLRERIDAISRVLVEVNPFIGRGPGSAQVEVQGQNFYFHNAYLAVRNNGGWVLLLLLLLLIGLIVVRLLRLPPAQHHPWHEASIIALLICALSLGEAFLRAPAALAIGLALRHAINPMELRRADGDDDPDHVF